MKALRSVRLWLVALPFVTVAGIALNLALAVPGDYNDPLVANLGQVVATIALAALLVLAVGTGVRAAARRLRARP